MTFPEANILANLVVLTSDLHKLFRSSAQVDLSFEAVVDIASYDSHKDDSRNKHIAGSIERGVVQSNSKSRRSRISKVDVKAGEAAVGGVVAQAHVCLLSRGKWRWSRSSLACRVLCWSLVGGTREKQSSVESCSFADARPGRKAAGVRRVPGGESSGRRFRVLVHSAHMTSIARKRFFTPTKVPLLPVTRLRRRAPVCNDLDRHDRHAHVTDAPNAELTRPLLRLILCLMSHIRA